MAAGEPRTRGRSRATGRPPKGRPVEERGVEWTFLTNHAHVLLCIAAAPEMRMREIAGLVGITERAVQRIVGDLVGGGYVGVTRNGRRNVYHVITTRPLRHALERHHSVSAILDLVALPKR